jgi:hypothetical protein
MEAGMRKTLEMMGSLLFSFFLFYWIANSVHEQFHNLVANALGVEGYVKFQFWMAHFHYVDTPSRFDDIVIGLSGGVLTALAFGLAWYVSQRQLRYTQWELDDAIALMLVAITHFVYAFFDAFWRVQTANGAAFAAIVAMIIALGIYGKPILKWLRETDIE